MRLVTPLFIVASGLRLGEGCEIDYAAIPLGTKRPYHAMPLDKPEILRFPPSESIKHLPSHCDTQAWGSNTSTSARAVRYVAVVARHGARFPTKGKMEQVIEFAEKICTAGGDGTHPVPADALAWCQTVMDTKDVRPGSLSALGAAEMQQLGAQIGSRYLANRTKDPSVRMLTSSSDRCKRSCEAFKEGVKDHWMPQDHSEHSCEAVHDHLLRPYRDCPLLQAVRDAFNPQHDDRFLADAVLAVAAATGLPPDSLSADDVHAAFYACQTEVSTNSGDFNGAFSCGMLGERMCRFDEEEDLENFFLRGFGRWNVTRAIAAPLLQHITERMDEAHVQDAGSSGPVVDLFFTHDSTVLPLAALMGLFDLGGTPESSQAARFCPFASRLIIEVLECGAVFVHYNDVQVRVLRGLEEWRESYREELATSFEQVGRA
ncbi:unnamed protein product [Chrysoparadoxa australica]